MALDIQIKEEGDRLNISERGRSRTGEVLSSDRRLYMQLYVLGGVKDKDGLIGEVEKANIQAVLYEDLNHPHQFGLLTFNESADYFATAVRSLFNSEEYPHFGKADIKEAFTMLGRSYSIGYESDLELALIKRPISRVTDPKNRWAIWYPLRRAGSFEQLSATEQRTILMEHGGVGRSYGEAGLAYDVRLACHGLDRNDNDFVIGLIGPELYPLSSVVQRMRKTKQTSEHLEKLGPFFIGRVIWQWELGEKDA